MSTFKPAVKDEIYTSDFANSIDRGHAWHVLNKWIGKSNGTGLLDKMLLADLMTYLPNDLLVKVDIASMANSLEARSPFLDHRVIEFAASLPEDLKMKRFRTKSLLKKVAARLVPRDVVYRPKMGFGVPVGRWFRGEMREFVRDILLSERSLDRGIVKRESIEQFVAQHTSGRVDHSFQIWTLLMLELWFQRFIDQ
jgi:asparagine synthase (glutamine-hydrolysing)